YFLMMRTPVGSLLALALVGTAEAVVATYLPPDAGGPLRRLHPRRRERVFPVPHERVRLILFALRVESFLLRLETQLMLMPFLALVDFPKRHRQIPSPCPSQFEASQTDPHCRPGRQ